MEIDEILTEHTRWPNVDARTAREAVDARGDDMDESNSVVARASSGGFAHLE